MVSVDKKVTELFEAGCHLGHKNNRVHPKARKYIYSIENGVSVIDLTKTVPLLEKAKEFVKSLSENNKSILFVATKKVSSSLVNKFCQEAGIPYVTLKWPAGFLTNFDMIMKNVKKLLTMNEDKKTGGWSKFVKHEQVQLQKEINKLAKFYGGLVLLKKLPDALFVIDIKKEKNAVKEGLEMKMPVVAVCDTNVDSAKITYPIPGNDDSLTSIEYFLKEIINSYGQVKTQNSKVKSETKN